MKESIEATLAGIFSADTGYSRTDTDVISTSPNYGDLRAFAEVLSTSSSEEDLQKYLTENPKFVMGMFGWGDESVLAFLTKPQIGTRYRADFAVLQMGQGGCDINLIELEPSSVQLYTQDGNRAMRHNGAWTQVRDWTAWIEANKSTFVREVMETVRNVPAFPERSENGSFRRRGFEEIEQAWRAFGGFEHPSISCTIVIGRWSNLTTEERRNLIVQNKYDGQLAQTITYDQLARSSFERPLRNW